MTSHVFFCHSFLLSNSTNQDVFLFQLRAFQQIRSTIIHPNEVNKSLQEITKQCKEMIHITLLRRNIPWFVEFFTELLLQIGLVPIQETDDDILNNVTDKDKLQKLHRRFTSKVGGVVGSSSTRSASQRYRSSQRLSLDSSDTRSVGSTGLGIGQSKTDNSNIAASMKTRTNMTSPDEYFTGHQEFFYRFIRFVDSYSFSIHLRNRIVSVITTMWSLDDWKGLEERIMKLQMLSKFLGVLAFSPNWVETENNSLLGESSLSAPGDMIEDLSTPFFDMKQFIEKGWKEQRLIITIPWIISYLQMMSWDESSMKRTYYRDIFSLMRNIHKWCIEQILVGCNYHTFNLLLLALQLESFFSEVVGLGEIECHSSNNLPAQDDGDNISNSLDTYNIGFTSSFIISSSSHLEDLQKLIYDLSRFGGNILIATGASKKLKPYVLSSYPTSISFSLIGEKQLQESIHDSNTTEKGFHREDNKIIGKMVDSFFHQHKDLQSICDFIIDLSLKSASKDIEKLGLDSRVKESYLKYSVNTEDGEMVILSDPIDIDWYLKILRNVELDTCESAILDFNRMIHNYISNAMKAVIPAHVNNQVKDIATKISFKHAYRKGESVITSFIRGEVKKCIEEHVKRGQAMASTFKYDKTLTLNNVRLSYGCDFTKLESSVQALYVFLSNTNESPVKDDDQKSVQEFMEQLDGAKNWDKYDVSIVVPVQSEMRRIMKDLLIKLISIAKYLLHYKQNVSNESPHDNSPNNPPLDIQDTMDLICNMATSNLFPTEIRQFSNFICQPIVLRSILLWLDADGYKGKNLTMISKAVTCSAIQKSHLKMKLMELLKSCTISQKMSINCLCILGALTV